VPGNLWLLLVLIYFIYNLLFSALRVVMFGLLQIIVSV